MGYVKQLEAYSGVMDSHFTNDTTVRMYNKSDKDYTINKGDKFCQVVVIPLPQVELEIIDTVQELEDRFEFGRGSACWGSSGK
jgi:dUTPase